MHIYHFAICNDAGDQEALGYFGLDDDDEAIAFGRETIRLIMNDDSPAYTGSVLSIIKGKHIVGSIPLDFEVSQQQKEHGRTNSRRPAVM